MDKTMYAPLDESVLQGFSKVRAEFRKEQVASAAALIADVKDGSVPPYYMQEAIAPRTPALMRTLMSNYPGLIRASESMTTSDFPILTGDVLDRMMLQRFRDYPSPWRSFVRVVNGLRDFRAVNRISMSGLDSAWTVIPEASEITYAAPDEAEYAYTPAKYGKAAKLSWELIMNDDLRAFDDIPNWLGIGGARTINRFVTSLYVDSSGPHGSVYTVGNGNIISGNPALSVASVATALGQLRAMTDTDGNPIIVESAVLVVPPALALVAESILNATEIRLTTSGGASGQELTTRNFVGSGLSMAVDPYIPIIATSNGDTSWFLFANPNMGAPAIEVGTVRGFEAPQLFQKISNTARLGGGTAQELGDFHTMSTEYKGVMAFGGAIIDPRSTVGSEGDGS